MKSQLLLVSETVPAAKISGVLQKMTSFKGKLRMCDDVCYCANSYMRGGLCTDERLSARVQIDERLSVHR